MQTNIAMKMIGALIVILIALLAALFIVTGRLENNGAGSDTDPDTEVSDIGSDGTADTGSDTEADTGSDTDSDTGSDSTGGENTEPPVTSDNGGNERPPAVRPENEVIILKTDSGVSLNLRIELTKVYGDEGDVKLIAELYLVHRELYMGRRTGCRLSIGDTTEVFAASRISYGEKETYSEYLATVERVCKDGEKVTVKASVPCRVTYSDVEIDKLTINEDIIV